MAKKESEKEMFRELAKKGGKATLKKYGKAHFSNIAKKRWEKEKSK